MTRAHLARAVGSTALAAILAAGCTEERTTVLDPVGPLSFDFLVPTSIARLPSGTTSGQSQYYVSATASDLAGGADFNLSLVDRTRTPAGFASIAEPAAVETVTVAAATTETSYAFTPPGFPGRDGFGGSYTMTFTVGGFSSADSATAIYARMVVGRVNAAGVLQGAVSVPPEQIINSGGLKTFTRTAAQVAGMGTWNAGDRLRVEYRFRNADPANPRFVVVATGAQTVVRPTRSVTLTLANLTGLSGGARYQFWALGRDAQNLDVSVPAYGSLVEFFSRVDTLANGDTVVGPTGDPVLVTDSSVLSLTQLNEYVGSADSATSWLRVVIDSTGDGGTPVTYHAIFVSREDGLATTPGSVRFLFRRIGLAATNVTASMLFGNFGGSDLVNLQSPADYVYAPVGAGTGGARGPEISVDFKEIPRPPKGFFYRGFILDGDGNSILVDTLRSAWNLDPTISRVSLYDADVNPLLPGLASTSIRASQVRNCAAGSAVNACQNTLALPITATFVGMAKFQLKLEPKGNSTTVSNALVSHAGDLPDEVKQ
jgi:hypothetical protein